MRAIGEDNLNIHKGWLEILNLGANELGLNINEYLTQINGADKPNEKVDIRDARHIHQHIIKNIHNDCFSIIAAKHVTPLTFGHYSLTLWTSPDVLTLLNNISDYSIALGTSIRVRFRNKGNIAELWLIDNLSCEKDVQLTTIGSILYLSTLLYIIRYAVFCDIKPCITVYLRNTPKAQAYADCFEKLFKCNVKYNHPIYMVTIDRDFLSTKLTYHNDKIYQQNKSSLKNQTIKMTSNDIVSKIYEILDHTSRWSELSKSGIASALFMSSRTLNRRLLESGTSYRGLIEKYKLEKALQLLEQPGIKKIDIAFQLGFSDSSSFTRAFKRWSGGTCPSKWHSIN
ncbi:MAG: helix-turn-helix domain-containing protein [Moritella sp.]|uniref:helix-turn-helix transcriptional regulator n=1 Tax=Moritella sp. TaxID=78556 RepID=UPI0025D4586D|nr:helix-turn-helix domain-containing protein [Moritella sp.]NQZ92439.1 helix-turn-helix domain-containing protein [Moritella sp.]